jgi:hypothetical protein
MAGTSPAMTERVLHSRALNALSSYPFNLAIATPSRAN